MRTEYLSERVRISKGNKGTTFVLVKENETIRIRKTNGAWGSILPWNLLGGMGCIRKDRNYYNLF